MRSFTASTHSAEPRGLWQVCWAVLLALGCGREPALPTQGHSTIDAGTAQPTASIAASASPIASTPAPATSANVEPTVLESRPLDPRAVERLVADARENDSAELVLIKDDQLVGDWRFSKARGPIPTMSITKCVLSLAIGTLIDRGKLGLQQPVHELYPEWNSGRKQRVTLFHLLTHTSGLDEGKGTYQIYRQKNFVKFSLESDILFEPGTHYRYSNRAANLLSGIVGKASGKRADLYVNEVLFEPLGIRETLWLRDASGQPHGLAGLHMLPRDLAKIGELLLHQGAHQGTQLVSREWIERSLREGSSTQPTNRRKGLAWSLIAETTHVTVTEAIVEGWRTAGAPQAFIDKTLPLVGRRFESPASFVDALEELFGDAKLSEWNENTWQRDVPDAHFEFGPIIGASAKGTLGQHLVVLPRDRLVAVRMRREPNKLALRNDPKLVFPDFVERVRGLVEKRPASDTDSDASPN